MERSHSRPHRVRLSLVPALALLLAVPFHSARAGSIRFFDPEPFAAGSEVRGLAAADLDGAPGLDIAFVRASGELGAIPNDGTGHFGTEVVLLSSGALAPVLAVDLEGDGVPDVACARSSPSRLTLFHNGGGMSFGAPADLPMPAPVAEVQLADLDGDGRPDLIVRHAGPAGIGVWRNLGGGAFALSSTPLAGQSVDGVAVGDFDGDGLPDITATYGYTNVVLMHGAGDGTFGPPSALPPPAIPATALLGGDLNGDGRADLIAVQPQPSIAAIAFQTGGVLGPWTSLGLGPLYDSRSEQMPVLADVDGDGALDLAAGRFGDPYTSADHLIRWMRNRGDGAFVPGPQFRTATNPSGLIVADFTGDGRPDVLTHNQARWTGDLPGLALLPRLPGNGFGGPQWRPYAVANTNDATGRVFAVRLAPGNPRDLFASQVTSDHTQDGVYRIPNDGTGVFLEGQLAFADAALDATMDVDGDGVDDLLLLRAAGGEEVWKNDGLGQLTLAGTLAIPPLLASGDADGDGMPDLWVRGADDTLQILAGHPSGAFDAPRSAHVWLPPEGFPSSFTAPHAADLDGDGRAEFAFTVGHLCDPAWELHILRNLGGFELALAESLAVPVSGPYPSYPDLCGFDARSLPLRLMVADVNGDHRRDLVLLRSSGTDGDAGQLQTFVQNAGGTFSATTPVFTTGGTDLAIADFDGDGLDDAAVSRSDGNGTDRAFLFHGAADGTLVQDLVTNVEDLPTGVVAADLDDNGRPDMAIASPRRRTVCVFRSSLPPPGPTAALVSLVSATVANRRIELEWQVAGVAGQTVALERDGDRDGWRALAMLPVDGAQRLRYQDGDVRPGTSYGYRLAWMQGGRRVTGGEAWVRVPAAATLAVRAAGGNPARHLALVVDVPEPGVVEVRLFDVIGRRVRDQRVSAAQPGPVAVRLEGPDPPPGLYHVRVAQGRETAATRLVLIR